VEKKFDSDSSSKFDEAKAKSLEEAKTKEWEALKEKYLKKDEPSMELTKEKVDLITQKKIDARKKVTDGYVLKGHVLKQVATDITPHLAGVLDGLAAEVLSDDSVNIFTLNRDKGIKAIPFATWRTGTINMSSSKRGLNLEYVVPEGRSKGYLMSKTNRVFIHLLA